MFALNLDVGWSDGCRFPLVTDLGSAEAAIAPSNPTGRIYHLVPGQRLRTVLLGAQSKAVAIAYSH